MSTFTIEELVDLEHPSEVQLSPDGASVAFGRGKANKADASSSFQKTIYLADVKTGSIRPLTAPNTGANDQPRWTPDSRQLAFVSNRGGGGETQLYLLDIVGGGEAQPLTDLRGEVDEPKWSADGRSIAFLYNGSLDPAKYVDPDPLVVDAGTRFKRVWLLDLASRELKPLTPEGEHVFEYAWSADGKTLAVLTSPHPNPIESWYSAQIHTVNVATGAMQRVCTMPNQIGRLTISPDGSRLAFVSGIMSDEGNVSGEVYIVPAAGGEPTNITQGVDYSITWIEWRDEGILFGGRQIEGAVLGWLDPESGEERWLDKGMYTVNGWGPQRVSASGSKTFAALRESFTERPSVYLGSLDTGKSRSLAAPDLDLGKFPPLRVENHYWKGGAGQPVHGYLVYPPNYQPGKRYPLFAHVHGGPSWSYVPRFVSAWERLLTDRGCLVFMPNPRGSWGRGHAFQSANVGDLGGGDWQDIMAGVDYLIDAGLADPDQMAVGGWSYGGYLTTWAVTQTDRFKCAIAGASITNYESNYGVVPNREWQTTMFGSNVYDDFELHRSRSPIAFANRVKTPTLLVHGDQDPYAPMQQAVEFYIALKHFNVPTQLVLYPREPHGFQERAHQIDMYQRLVGWVDKYLFGVG